MSAPLRLFCIAGEPSGDRLGAALVRGLRAELGERALHLQGVGGAALAAEGLESLFPIGDIAVMGLAEVLPKLPTILARLKATATALEAAAPDLVVTIDAPDFGLRVADRVRAKLPETRFVHYVAPSVWAWRPGRAKKLARRVDHLLALLPFEPPYFEKEGLSCDSVGHPVVEATASIAPGDRAFRAELGIGDDQPLIVVLPGSRRGEVERLRGVFGAALGVMTERRPRLAVVVPAAENVADLAAAVAETWRRDHGVAVTLLDPRGRPFAEAESRKFRAMAAADAALAASGTVSLELAAMETPMVIAYKLNPISAGIARHLIKVDTAVLVNLISETRAVPDFLQEYCTVEALTGALEPLLDPASPERAAQLAAARLTMERLGRGAEPPSRRAARSVLAALDRSKP